MEGVRSEGERARDLSDSRVPGSEVASIRDRKRGLTKEDEGGGRRSPSDSRRAADRENFAGESHGVTRKDDINAKDDTGYRQSGRDEGRRRLERYERRGEDEGTTERRRWHPNDSSEEDGREERRIYHHNDSSEDEEGKAARLGDVRPSEKRSGGRRQTFPRDDDKRKQSHKKPADDVYEDERHGGEKKGSYNKEDGGDDDDEHLRVRRGEYRSRSTKDEVKRVEKDSERRHKDCPDDDGNFTRRTGRDQEDHQRYTSRYRDGERSHRSSRREGNDDDFDKRKDRRKGETSQQGNHREGEEISNRKIKRPGGDAHRRVDESAERIGRETQVEYEKNKTRHGERSRGGNLNEGNGNVDTRQIPDKKTEQQDYHKTGKPVEVNLGRSGGIYIPPFKLAQMMKNVEDKSSEEYQRLTWDALRKSINGLVNKVNASNVKNIIPELFSENLVRGRGLFCRSCLKSQMASPGFTDVFAALVAVVNTKFPVVGKLLLKRIILRLKRAYKRNDKPLLLAAIKFIAHLVNQQVAHEIIALELLTVLLENPTDDSVEVAVGFVKECGSLLQDLSSQGLHGMFERLRGILHEGEIDKRVQFLIEGLFAIRKAKFQGYPAVRPELDLVEQEDQFTHEVSLEDEIDGEEGLDIFKYDPQFLDHEKAYENLKREILGDESSEDEDGSDATSDEEEDDESDQEDEQSLKIKDETETNLVNLRRTIYLTIMSSIDFEEAGHKLLKIKLQPGQEMELCIMLLECCSQERTYLRYYGLLGQRFCMINKVHQENFEKCFVQQYSMIHRLETNKLRNVAKFFSHLLGTDALPWHVLAYIRLTEEDTTSSSRIFIKILFQELAEQLGIRTLNERLSDPTMQDSFESIFPRDNPKNTRFSINFFTSIGLGGITENLRQYLKDMPRLIMQQQKPESGSDDSQSGSAGDSGSSSASESDDSDSSSETESESSSESDKRHTKRKRKSNSESESDGKRRRKQKYGTNTENEGRHRKHRHQSHRHSDSGSDDDGHRRHGMRR